MKLSVVKPFIVLMFFGLAVANVGIFISGTHLSDRITFYEDETERLKEENEYMEQKIDEINSLQKAGSAAAELGYTKKAEPNYLENLDEALQ